MKCFPEFCELFRQISEPEKKAGRTAQLWSAPQKGGKPGHPRCGWQLQQGRLLGARFLPLESVLTPGGSGRTDPSFWTHLVSEAAS